MIPASSTIRALEVTSTADLVLEICFCEARLNRRKANVAASPRTWGDPSSRSRSAGLPVERVLDLRVWLDSVIAHASTRWLGRDGMTLKQGHNEFICSPDPPRGFVGCRVKMLVEGLMWR